MICHLPESSFLATGASPLLRSISTCLISASLRVRIAGGASLAGAPSLAFSDLLDQYRTPPRPAIKTAATIRRVKLTGLPPAPPYAHAGQHDQQREADHARVENQADLTSVHVERAIRRLLGPDGDEVFIRREPVEHVGEQVAVAVETEESVLRPAGGSDDDEAAVA